MCPSNAPVQHERRITAVALKKNAKCLTHAFTLYSKRPLRAFLSMIHSMSSTTSGSTATTTPSTSRLSAAAAMVGGKGEALLPLPSLACACCKRKRLGGACVGGSNNSVHVPVLPSRTAPYPERQHRPLPSSCPPFVQPCGPARRQARGLVPSCA